MAKQLLGKEVNEALVANLLERSNALKEKGIQPCLGKCGTQSIKTL